MVEAEDAMPEEVVPDVRRPKQPELEDWNKLACLSLLLSSTLALYFQARRGAVKVSSVLHARFCLRVISEKKINIVLGICVGDY